MFIAFIFLLDKHRIRRLKLIVVGIFDYWSRIIYVGINEHNITQYFSGWTSSLIFKFLFLI